MSKQNIFFTILIFCPLSIAAQKKTITTRFCLEQIAQKAIPLDKVLHKMLGKARGFTPKPNKEVAEIFVSRMRGRPGWISEDLSEEWKAEFNLSEDEFLMTIAEAAKKLAKPAISNYFVGESARAGSGRVYWSVNVEFPGLPLNHTIHGEQYMVALLRLHKETHIKTLGLPAPPCGHCRQFLRELKNWKESRILIPGEPPYFVSELLPHSFGPDALGLTEALLDSKPWKIEPLASSKILRMFPTGLLTQSLELASLSYSPYSKSPSGVILQDIHGRTYRGMNIDNAAFNPSLSALSSALVDLVSRGGDLSLIKTVILVEEINAMRSELELVRSVVGKFTRNATMVVLPVRVIREN